MDWRREKGHSGKDAVRNADLPRVDPPPLAPAGWRRWIRRKSERAIEARETSSTLRDSALRAGTAEPTGQEQE